MHLRGLLSTEEGKVALGYHLVRLLQFFHAKQPPVYIYSSIVYAVYRVTQIQLKQESDFAFLPCCIFQKKKRTLFLLSELHAEALTCSLYSY